MKDSNGIALIIVIWVLAVMTAAVFSFSLMARTEAGSTLSFKENMEKKFIAEAGVERAIMEICYRMQNANDDVILQGRESWKIDGTRYTGSIGAGSYAVRIWGETGKLDVNSAPEILIKNLLLNAGVTGDDADIIVDSIMDWKDPDDLTRLHGAESDYYMSLPNPYKAKNADFDTLEELLLVRGVTPELLYGSADKRGIADLLTVSTKSSMVDVNYAPKEVLAAIPGIGDAAADAIIRYRKEKVIRNVQEIQGLLGDSYQAAAPYIGIVNTNAFTIEAKGYKKDGKAGYPIRVTVRMDNNSSFRYLYYKSPAYGRDESDNDNQS